MSKRLVRTAFLTLGLTVITNTSAPSWAEKKPCRLEREACAEAAAKYNTQPLPDGCAEQDVVETQVCINRQRQDSCKIVTVPYQCTKLDVAHRPKKEGERLKYFPLGSAEEGTPTQQGDVYSNGPESETPSQAEPVPSERPLWDRVLFPDAGASPSELAKLLPPKLRYSPPERLATGNMWPVTSMTLSDGTKVLTSYPANDRTIMQLYEIEYKRNGVFHKAYQYLPTNRTTQKGARNAPPLRRKRR